MAIKLQKTNSAITGNNFIADERIKQAEILTKQGSPWKGRYYRAIGNMEKIPVLGSIVLAADKKRDPIIAQREKAWKISQFSPSQKQLDQVQKIWSKECAEQGIGTLKSSTPQKATPTRASEPKPKPAKASLDGFELTKEDETNFNAALTLGLCLAAIPYAMPYLTAGAQTLHPWIFGLVNPLIASLPIIPLIGPMLLEQINQIPDNEEIVPSWFKKILSHMNPSFMAFATMKGTVFNQVTVPSLFNPFGFFRKLWNISAPGQTINRIPLTRRQITRGWKGMQACYNNLGTAPITTIAKNFAVHFINTAAAITSHYLIANLAFENGWYLTTALANKTPWIKDSNTVGQMSEMCKAARDDFSFWNLAGLNKNSWNTIFSWNESFLWNLVPIFGFDKTKMFSCGNDFPSLAKTTQQGFSYIKNYMETSST